MLSVLSIHLDPAAVRNLKAFAKECLIGDRNPCVNGDYDDPDVPTAAFAAGKTAAMFGYSERLFLIRRSAPQDHFHFSSAPIGNGNHPLLFTDAFVLRKDCDQRCEAAVRRPPGESLQRRAFIGIHRPRRRPWLARPPAQVRDDDYVFIWIVSGLPTIRSEFFRSWPVAAMNGPCYYRFGSLRRSFFISS